jgi:7 transmembrane receptor (Secretin family)
MWMTIEGHHLYCMLVKVFHSGRDFTRIYLALGYGVPAIVVAITGIVTASLQDTGYGNDEM